MSASFSDEAIQRIGEAGFRTWRDGQALTMPQTQPAGEPTESREQSLSTATQPVEQLLDFVEGGSGSKPSLPCRSDIAHC